MRSWACTQAWTPCSGTRARRQRTGSCTTRQLDQQGGRSQSRQHTHVPGGNANAVDRGRSDESDEQRKQDCNEHTMSTQVANSTTNNAPSPQPLLESGEKMWTRFEKNWRKQGSECMQGRHARRTTRSVTKSKELTKPPTTVMSSDDRNSAAKICSTGDQQSACECSDQPICTCTCTSLHDRSSTNSVNERKADWLALTIAAHNKRCKHKSKRMEPTTYPWQQRLDPENFLTPPVSDRVSAPLFCSCLYTTRAVL